MKEFLKKLNGKPKPFQLIIAFLWHIGLANGFIWFQNKTYKPYAMLINLEANTRRNVYGKSLLKLFVTYT